MNDTGEQFIANRMHVNTNGVEYSKTDNLVK